MSNWRTEISFTLCFKVNIDVATSEQDSFCESHLGLEQVPSLKGRQLKPTKSLQSGYKAKTVELKSMNDIEKIDLLNI